jgi:hypothetical protein
MYSGIIHTEVSFGWSLIPWDKAGCNMRGYFLRVQSSILLYPDAELSPQFISLFRTAGYVEILDKHTWRWWDQFIQASSFEQYSGLKSYNYAGLARR